MEQLAHVIVKNRNKILIIATLLLIPSMIGFIRTKVNYDILTYLPKEAESMMAQQALSDDFNLASTGMLVVEHMPDKQVAKLKEEIMEIDGVKEVLWYDNIFDLSMPPEVLPDSFRNFLFSEESTMMIITFEEETSSQRTMDALHAIKGYAEKGCYIGGFSAIIEDTKSLVGEETWIYSVTAVVLCLIVLFLGLSSTLAPLIFMVGIAYPIAYNFGSNVFLGEISYITQALAMVLQLGVTMDYSIFLLHRYHEEKEKNTDREEAMAHAIMATFTSITSSSITTVAGFLALCAMRLTLGRDIGIVMAKGVVLGVISTILILPSLIMLFDRQIERWTHPIFIKELKYIPQLVVRHHKAILVCFLLLFGPMLYAQANTNVYYDLTSTLPEELISTIGTNKLKEQFHMTTTHFVLVDEHLNSRESKALSDEIEQLDGVSSILSYDQLIGGRIPNEMQPQAVKDILQNGGRKMILVNSDYTAASDEEMAQLEAINEIIHRYDENALIAGEGPLTRDLITTTDVDFKVVNLLSIAAIFLIIALVFRSVSLPIILVLTIEFAININMGIPYFTGTVLPFIAGIVIGTIQLGATVDYAILLTSRFREELQNGNSSQEAMKIAIMKSSPSIITSGLSFFAACIGVSFISKMDLIKSLCLLISRGALISMFAILVILPALLLVFHKTIARTTKHWPQITAADQ